VLMRGALRASVGLAGKVSVIESKHLGFEFMTDRQVESDNEGVSALISTENKSYNEIVTDFQRQLITQVMEENDHVWAKAARQLQLDRGNLHRQAKRLGLT